MEEEVESLRIEPSLTIVEEDIDILAIRWNNDDSLLAAGCSDGTVRFYEGGTGTFVRSLSCRNEEDAMPVTSLRWRPSHSSAKTKNVLLATTASGGIHHWHATSGKSLHQTSYERNQILAADYESEGRFFAVGCKDFSVKVVDESTKHLVVTLSGGDGETVGHSNRVFSVKWINEHLLASGGWDSNVFIWDIRSGESTKYIHGIQICGDAIDAHQNQLLLGNYDVKNQLQLWDWDEHSLLYNETIMAGHKPLMPYTAQFSKTKPGQYFAIAGTGTEEVLLYSNAEKKRCGVITEVGHTVFSVDFANTTDRIALSCGEGYIRTYNLIGL